MMKISIVSLGLLFAVSVPSFSQEVKLSGHPLPFLEQLLVQSSNQPLFASNLNLPLLKKITISTKNGKPLSTPSQSMPLVYAYKDLALFCKLEVQLEKIVKLPVKFRLGSVDYVDWLEGKRDSY